MAAPTTRAEFKAYCLRRLGAPVIEINVDDDQVEDRIDDALRDRKSTRLNSSHVSESRMPSSA